MITFFIWSVFYWTFVPDAKLCETGEYFAYGRYWLILVSLLVPLFLQDIESRLYGSRIPICLTVQVIFHTKYFISVCHLGIRSTNTLDFQEMYSHFNLRKMFKKFAIYLSKSHQHYACSFSLLKQSSKCHLRLMNVLLLTIGIIRRFIRISLENQVLIMITLYGEWVWVAEEE